MLLSATFFKFSKTFKASFSFFTDLEKRVNKADHLMEALAQEREEIKKSEAKEKRRKNGKKNVA